MFGVQPKHAEVCALFLAKLEFNLEYATVA